MGNEYFYTLDVPINHNYNNYIYFQTEFGQYKIKIPNYYKQGEKFIFKIYIDNSLNNCLNINPFDLSLLNNNKINYYDIGD